MPSKKNENLLEEARNRYRIARRADKKERQLAEDDIKFAINDEGCQWDKDVRDIRQGANPPRPCLVMNKIPEKIDQAEGEFRQLKPSIKVRGVDSNADPKVAEIIAGIIRNIEYNSTARAAYNTAYSCVLHGGRGAWRYDIVESKDDPFEMDIEINRIPNALSITWDPSAKKIDKSDGNFLFIDEDIDVSDFKSRWPKVSLEGWPDDDSHNEWKREDTIKIAEYWWIEKGKRTAYRVNRNNIEMTVWKLNEGEKAIKQKEVNHPKVKWCKMVATEVLEGPHEDWPGIYIPIVIEVGKETNVNGVSKTRGMVRFGKVPQQMYNYWSSAEAEQITTMPKAPYLMTPKMMGPHKRQWDDANTKNFSVLYFEADVNFPGQFPKREMPPMASTATLAAKQGMEHDIMSGMNVYSASLGDEGSEISGKAIDSRKRQGSIGGYTYVDNFEYALIHGFKILLNLIPDVWPGERIVRIRDEGGKESLVPINARKDSPLLQTPGLDEEKLIQTDASEYINDITVGKYDVVATIGASYTTQREEALDKIIRVLEAMPQLAAVSPDLVVALLDMPMSDELLKRAKKIVPVEIRGLEPGEEPPPEQPPSPEAANDAAKIDLEQKKLQLSGIEEMRKGFEAKIDGIAKLMSAESKEQGQQLQEIAQFMTLLKEQEDAKQNIIQESPPQSEV